MRSKSWLRRVLFALLVSLAHVVLIIVLLVSAPAPPVSHPDPPILLGLERGLPSGARPASLPPAATETAALKPLSFPPPPPITLPAPPASPTAPSSASMDKSAALQPGPLTAAAGVSAGDDCGMLTHLQARLRDDAAVLKALRAIPIGARSVANAVQLWDGAWISPASLGGLQVFEPLRDAVVQTVLSASESCQLQTVRGPRLIAVPDGAGATVIGLGSGVWVWKDLTAEPRTATGGPPS